MTRTMIQRTHPTLLLLVWTLLFHASINLSRNTVDAFVVKVQSPTAKKCRSNNIQQPQQWASTRDETRTKDSDSLPSSSLVKDQLLSLISSTPSNAPSSKDATQDILTVVRNLEAQCPTPEEQVVPKLGGNWELLWTAQDQTTDEGGLGPLRTWINPLENQSYSNNPNTNMGRANPVLPRPVQDRLEKIGLIGKDAEPVRSSQGIDLKRGQVRNIVSFAIPSIGKSRKATVTVTVDFKPNLQDKRRVDVKFQFCRVAVNNSPININIPLGIIGPTGWLRTGYIDDTMRITRGHKGSIFILKRPSP